VTIKDHARYTAEFVPIVSEAHQECGAKLLANKEARKIGDEHATFQTFAVEA
jgi:hypothetical protein